MVFKGEVIFRNGQYVSSTVDIPACSKVVYEVVRLIQGKILFWDDHYSRLINSLRLVGMRATLDEYNFKEIIRTLCLRNNETDINVWINVCAKEHGDVIVGFIPSFYPDESFYRNGVNTVTLKAERPEPAAKVVHTGLQKKIREILSDRTIYEVILVNHLNCLTEGSRSNLFFISNNKVYTSGLDGVLPGITRQKVIDVCTQNGIEVNVGDINKKDIAGYDSAFITGTSPKVLPVRAIDSTLYQMKNPLLQTIMAHYNLLISKALY